jgi:hypothetical protein
MRATRKSRFPHAHVILGRAERDPEDLVGIELDRLEVLGSPRFALRPRMTMESYTVSGCFCFSGTTPSFFCRLVEDVVYWKSSFLSGKT